MNAESLLVLLTLACSVNVRPTLTFAGEHALLFDPREDLRGRHVRKRSRRTYDLVHRAHRASTEPQDNPKNLVLKAADARTISYIKDGCLRWATRLV
jgi:hypothetical protein